MVITLEQSSSFSICAVLDIRFLLVGKWIFSESLSDRIVEVFRTQIGRHNSRILFQISLLFDMNICIVESDRKTK